MFERVGQPRGAEAVDLRRGESWPRAAASRRSRRPRTRVSSSANARRPVPRPWPGRRCRARFPCPPGGLPPGARRSAAAGRACRAGCTARRRPWARAACGRRTRAGRRAGSRRARSMAHLAHRLRGVGVEDDRRIGLLGQPGELLDGEDHAGLVVGVHDADQQRVGPQGADELADVEVALAVDFQEGRPRSRCAAGPCRPPARPDARRRW